MEWETSKIVTKILTRRELDKVPNEIVKKIEKYFEESFDEFLTTQALYDTEKRTNGKRSLPLFYLLAYYVFSLMSIE